MRGGCGTNRNARNAGTLLLLLLAVTACSRRDYRLRADRDAYGLITEKTLNTPWQVPQDYSIYPSPASRLADATSPDFPCLPSPGPTIYTASNTRRATPGPEASDGVPAEPAAEVLPIPSDDGSPATLDQATQPLPSEPAPPHLVLRRFPPVDSSDGATSTAMIASTKIDAEVMPASFQSGTSTDGTGELPAPLPALDPPRGLDPAREPARLESSDADQPLSSESAAARENTPDPGQKQTAAPTPEAGTTQAAVQPVPAEYWSALPTNCLTHMLEFASVRDEYDRSYSPQEQLDVASSASTLGLSDLIRIARANSREYQTEKERLYVAALAVSLERFDYQLKPTPSGNGSAVDYVHARNDGITVNTLGVPTTFGMERMLATGGNLLARFANDVVLTFNGPQGFTADVASELFFELTQSILQRDILLEPLISSERNLVYAARTFARYRKTFFFDVASQYYGILRTYRAIEINSQNYFSLVRTVEQAQAEVRAAVKNAPNQVAVDQFEQSMLSGRSNLIEACNRLERELDQLKLTLGLPTEYPIRLNLQELERLTLLDETEVALERVRRWQSRVVQQRNQPLLQRADLLNADLFMLERLFEWQDLRAQTATDQAADAELSELQAILSFEQARNDVARTREEYGRVSDASLKQPPVLIYLRTTELLETLLVLLDRQIARMEADPALDEPTRAARRQRIDLERRLDASRNALAGSPDAGQLSRLFADAQRMRQEAERLSARLDEAIGYDTTLTDEDKDRLAIEITDALLALTSNRIEASGQGLPAVNIDVNDAMLTAMIQRLDMMNERGFLADDWRRVKLASDDLRSVLNLNASHSLRTDKNEPFDFDFDDSRTTMRLSLDLPFNRRAQRNRYRQALIGYQAGRRSVMQLEDSIKFDIRNGLRTLELTRVQYPISVTQAALAAEQVISIRLQLALGTPNVRGTDLLDALQGSRQALTSVANARIGYLVDRAQFVLNLELMQLDDEGFWPQINDENYQPQPDLIYPPLAGPTYGRLSPCVKPSRLMYHIYCHPLPGEAIEVREPDPQVELR